MVGSALVHTAGEPTTYLITSFTANPVPRTVMGMPFAALESTVFTITDGLMFKGPVRKIRNCEHIHEE